MLIPITLIIVFLLSVCAWCIINQSFYFLSLLFWLTALGVSFYFIAIKNKTVPKAKSPHHWIDLVAVVFFTFIQLLLLRYFSSIPTHFHQDEFITAYASVTLPYFTEINWFSGYPVNWVARFPILFHILQWPFLFFNTTVDAVRISIWPYLIATNIFTYLLAKTLWSRNFAVIALATQCVMAPTLYLFSMGLHFASSMCFYMGSLYFFTKLNESENRFIEFFLGVFVAFSYLTYTSSYVTAPVVIGYTLIYVLTTHKWNVALKLSRALLMTTLVLFPFLVYSLSIQNYFTERASQVNALWGSWSDSAKFLEQGNSPVQIILSQIGSATLSIIQPGVGGAGGYWFGKLALLDQITFVFFVLGIGLSIYKIARHKEFVLLLILFAFLIPFFVVFTLTSHPPNFQRLSVSYPIMAIIISLPIYTTFEFFNKKFMNVHYVLILLILLMLTFTNLKHAEKMISKDSEMYPQNTRVIGEFINNQIPKKETIRIAAFESFHVGQELTFRTHNNYSIETNDAKNIIPFYNGDTLLIILNAMDEDLTLIRQKLPNTTITTTLGNTHLGDLTLVIPEGIKP